MLSTGWIYNSNYVKSIHEFLFWSFLSFHLSCCWFIWSNKKQHSFNKLVMHLSCLSTYKIKKSKIHLKSNNINHLRKIVLCIVTWRMPKPKTKLKKKTISKPSTFLRRMGINSRRDSPNPRYMDIIFHSIYPPPPFPPGLN